jgi:hypothetical protein
MPTAYPNVPLHCSLSNSQSHNLAISSSTTYSLNSTNGQSRFLTTHPYSHFIQIVSLTLTSIYFNATKCLELPSIPYSLQHQSINQSLISESPQSRQHKSIILSHTHRAVTGFSLFRVLPPGHYSAELKEHDDSADPKTINSNAITKHTAHNLSIGAHAKTLPICDFP